MLVEKVCLGYLVNMELQPPEPKPRIFGNQIKEAIKIVRNLRQDYRARRYRKLEALDELPELDSDFREEEEEQGL